MPVIATLLQFSALELGEAERAIREPVYAARLPKEVKLTKKVVVIGQGRGQGQGQGSSHGLLAST